MRQSSLYQIRHLRPSFPGRGRLPSYFPIPGQSRREMSTSSSKLWHPAAPTTLVRDPERFHCLFRNAIRKSSAVTTLKACEKSLSFGNAEAHQPIRLRYDSQAGLVGECSASYAYLRPKTSHANQIHIWGRNMRHFFVFAQSPLPLPQVHAASRCLTRCPLGRKGTRPALNRFYTGPEVKIPRLRCRSLAHLSLGCSEPLLHAEFYHHWRVTTAERHAMTAEHGLCCVTV